MYGHRRKRVLLKVVDLKALKLAYIGMYNVLKEDDGYRKEYDTHDKRTCKVHTIVKLYCVIGNGAVVGKQCQRISCIGGHGESEHGTEYYHDDCKLGIGLLVGISKLLENVIHYRPEQEYRGKGSSKEYCHQKASQGDDEGKEPGLSLADLTGQEPASDIRCDLLTYQST